MSLAPARTSDLIRTPKAHHLAFLDRYADFVWDHISYCGNKVAPCLVMFCREGNTVERGYLPLRFCSIITLMAYGFEEHEAIEVEKAVRRCDLKSRAAVLVVDSDWKSGRLSFVEMEV